MKNSLRVAIVGVAICCFVAGASWAIDFGTDIIFEVVNGAGLNEADASKVFDTDEYKNFLGRVSQSIGDFLRIGAFAYYGKENQRNDSNMTATDEIMIYGPDMTISINDLFELNLQYVQRFDKNVFAVSGDKEPMKDVETKGAFAELIFTPHGDDSRWYGAGLFNWLESDLPGMDYKTATLHAG